MHFRAKVEAWEWAGILPIPPWVEVTQGGAGGVVGEGRRRTRATNASLTSTDPPPARNRPPKPSLMHTQATAMVSTFAGIYYLYIFSYENLTRSFTNVDIFWGWLGPYLLDYSLLQLFTSGYFIYFYLSLLDFIVSTSVFPLFTSTCRFSPLFVYVCVSIFYYFG